MRRLPRCLAAALAAASVAAPAARADGDPASDVLLTADVFLPTPAPSAAAAGQLQQQAEAVYDAGFRVKVSVIASPVDLGAIPSLFAKPADYARFLGTELTFVYVGPLLVVMPAGFGIYDGGRPTTAEEHVLASLKVTGPAPDELASSGAAAVDALLRAGALESKDVLRPYWRSSLSASRGAAGRSGSRTGSPTTAGEAACNSSSRRARASSPGCASHSIASRSARPTRRRGACRRASEAAASRSAPRRPTRRETRASAAVAPWCSCASGVPFARPGPTRPNGWRRVRRALLR